MAGYVEHADVAGRLIAPVSPRPGVLRDGDAVGSAMHGSGRGRGDIRFSLGSGRHEGSHRADCHRRMTESVLRVAQPLAKAPEPLRSPGPRRTSFPISVPVALGYRSHQSTMHAALPRRCHPQSSPRASLIATTPSLQAYDPATVAHGPRDPLIARLLVPERRLRVPRPFKGSSLARPAWVRSGVGLVVALSAADPRAGPRAEHRREGRRLGRVSFYPGDHLRSIARRAPN